jgi:hypothetical protein
MSFKQLVSTNTTTDSEILKKKFTCTTKSILSYYFLQAQEVLQCHYNALCGLKVYIDKVLEPATRISIYLSQI